MGEIEKLQNLLNQLLNGIQIVVQSGEQISDEFQGQLAEELQFLTSRIDELKQEQVPIVPDLDKSMDSSVINAFKFDPKNGNLLVQFKGKFPNEAGSVYSYGGVGPQIFELFKRGAIPAKTRGKNQWGSWWEGKSPSMGSSMNVLLKQMGLPVTKLT